MLCLEDAEGHAVTIDRLGQRGVGGNGDVGGDGERAVQLRLLEACEGKIEYIKLIRLA